MSAFHIWAPAALLLICTMAMIVWAVRAVDRHTGCRCGMFPISDRATVRWRGILHTRGLCQPDREVIS